MILGLAGRARAVIRLRGLRPSQVPALSYTYRHPTTRLPTLSTTIMFHRASLAKEAEMTKQQTTRGPFLLSSSPLSTQASITQFQSKHARPLSTSSSNIQRANQQAKPQRNSNGSSSNIGVKRTSGGLEKVLSRNDDFEDVHASASNTQDKPIVIADDTPTRRVTSVYFDENDFDSDLDLDVEDLASKGTVTYPTLPPIDTIPRPSFQPTAARQSQNTTSTYDSGYGSGLAPGTSTISKQRPPPSSGHVPWSSSPPEHHAPPPNRGSITQFLQPTIQEEDKSQAPKRSRRIPWAQKEDPVSTINSFRHDDTKSKGEFTPLPKNSKNADYPWNTTASAVKEQQKNLRQANKISKTQDAGENALTAAVFKKKKSLPKPFLSSEQQHILDLVVEQKKSVFFTGSAGTGKSVLMREIITSLKKKFHRETDRVAVTASTGLAACNVGGITLHSFAGFGLGKEAVPELIKKIKRNQTAKHRWMRVKVLVMDEISMVDGEFFDKLEECARRMRNNARPFGGIQLVITGDFFQLPPVPDYGKLAKFAFDAATWGSSIDHTIALHHVFRQKDPVFAGMLNEMREGRLSPQSIQAFRKLSRPIIFDDGMEMEATELFPTRQEVEVANNRRMNALPGEARVFEARDGGSLTDKTARDKLLQNCMAPDVVRLKKGSQVMLIKNYDENLVNGSLGKVIGFMSEAMFDSYEQNDEQVLGSQPGNGDEMGPADRKVKSRMDGLVGSSAQIYPVVRFVISDGTSRDLLCQRETWKIELPNGEVQASRMQVPLILAWALSIHKAQGQTLERVKVDLGKVFEKGQAYVALSRATSMAGLQVLRFEPSKIMAHEKVRGFYANLSRVEALTGSSAASKTKKRKTGMSIADFARAGADEYGDDGELLSAYA